MKLAFQIFLLVFNLLNITFHGVGIYAIASLYKRSKHKPQRLYILSLSASEVFINFLEIFRNLPGKNIEGADYYSCEGWKQNWNYFNLGVENKIVGGTFWENIFEMGPKMKIKE